jgi:hypothetical protein
MEIKAASMPPLMADGGVAIRFKMRTYYRVRSAFKPDCVVPSTMIGGIDAAFNLFKRENK